MYMCDGDGSYILLDFGDDRNSHVGIYGYSWRRIAAYIKAKRSEKANASACNQTSHLKNDVSARDVISASFFATVAMFALDHIVFQ